METRNVVVRTLAGLGWLVTFYFGSNMLMGVVVGAIAGASTKTYEAGQAAGTEATLNFFQSYGVYILLAQLIVFSLLAFGGKLPGTTKYKSANDS